MYISTYGHRKTWLDQCLKSHVSEDPSTSDVVNGAKHCSKLNDSTFTIFIDPFQDNSGWKSFWVICKILGLFVNPLRADLKYSLLNKGNLLQHLQMPLSQKWKIFSQLFFAFPKLRFNFEHFPKKDDLHSWRISELTDSKKRVWRKV